MLVSKSFCKHSLIFKIRNKLIISMNHEDKFITIACFLYTSKKTRPFFFAKFYQKIYRICIFKENNWNHWKSFRKVIFVQACILVQKYILTKFFFDMCLSKIIIYFVPDILNYMSDKYLQIFVSIKVLDSKKWNLNFQRLQISLCKYI